MYIREYQLAPLPEIVRYLSIFQRTFRAIVDYTDKNEKEGILLGGWLSDALHNAPIVLLSFTEQAPYTPREVSDYLQIFAQRMQRFGASKRIVRDAEKIVSLDYEPAELGLNADLSNIALAPEAELWVYLDLLQESFVKLRIMFDYGRKPVNRVYQPFKDLDEVWTKEADEYAAMCRKMAAFLLPVPKGLVHWDRFDAEEFQQTGRRLYRENWDTYWSQFISQAEKGRDDGNRTHV